MSDSPPDEVAPIPVVANAAPSPDIEPINLENVPVRNRRRRYGALVAAVGVAASLFVGALAIGAYVGNGGGSDTPEGAVRQLADAVSHEDPIAAAAVLAPDEVRSLSGTLTDAEKRAQELALANTANAPLAGVDLAVDNLSLSTQTLATGYAKVTVNSGTISAKTTTGEFSPLIQHALHGEGDASAQADLATLAKDAKLPTFVMTVERNGHWYVSAAYTALEYMREANNLPAADFGSGEAAVATLGSATPDAAVSDSFDALSKGDWQKLIALAPPDEIPVYDYRAAILQLAGDSKVNFTVDKVTTSSTITGDTAKVKLTANGTSGSGGTWSVDGSCVTLPSEPTDISGGSEAITDPGSTSNTTASCGFANISGLPLTEDLPGNGTSADITAVQENGRWFVSPVGTILDFVDQAIGSVTERTMDTILDVPDLLPPDGALTLGQPVTLPAGFGDDVYTYAGHQGEQLLGLATPKSQDQDGFSTAEARIFGPDGKELQNEPGLLEGEAVTLPADGTYKVVIESFDSGTTVTIWDAVDAPEAAKHPLFAGATGSCTYSVGGGETCQAVPGPAKVVPSEGSSAPTSAAGSASSSTGSGKSSESPSSTLPQG